MRYFIKLAYNGKKYCGWQSQPHSLGVQEVIENALSLLLRTPISIVGAGRTDSGVHAKESFAHFDFEGQFPENLVQKLNSFLAKDIVILQIFRMKPQAHARFSAVKRTYEYHISLEKNPFLFEYSYYFHRKLNVEKMNEACAILKEYTDFQCFSKTKTDVFTYNCNIENAFWEIKENQLIFHISADRFLRNMVRAIVGTLLEIGQERLSLQGFRQVIESKNRSKAGFSVPAHALYLTAVEYPSHIFHSQV